MHRDPSMQKDAEYARSAWQNFAQKVYLRGRVICWTWRTPHNQKDPCAKVGNLNIFSVTCLQRGTTTYTIWTRPKKSKESRIWTKLPFRWSNRGLIRTHPIVHICQCINSCRHRKVNHRLQNCPFFFTAYFSFTHDPAILTHSSSLDVCFIEDLSLYPVRVCQYKTKLLSWHTEQTFISEARERTLSWLHGHLLWLFQSLKSQVR